MYKIERLFSYDIKTEMKKWIGEELVKYRCDQFTFGNQVYQIVGLFIGNKCFKLTNCTEVITYFGSEEDICFLNLDKCGESEIVSGLKDGHQIDVFIGRKICRIEISQEYQHLKTGNAEEYRYDFIRGFSIVFEDGYEVAFEKTDPFSEEIAITRGEALLEKFQPYAARADFDENCHFVCERKKEIVS